MAQKGNLPPRDIGQANVASPMEHRAPEEVLPINKGTNNDTPHFQFISFQLVFTIYSTFKPEGQFFISKEQFLHVLLRGVI